MSEVERRKLDLTLCGNVYRIDEPNRRRSRELFRELMNLQRMFPKGSKGKRKPTPEETATVLSLIDKVGDFLVGSFPELEEDKELILNYATEGELIVAYQQVAEFISAPFVSSMERIPELTQQTNTEKAEPMS